MRFSRKQEEELNKSKEDNMERPDYKSIVMGIKSSCETTLRCNKRIMDREFKDYDGRYYDKDIFFFDKEFEQKLDAVVEEKFGKGMGIIRDIV